MAHTEEQKLELRANAIVGILDALYAREKKPLSADTLVGLSMGLGVAASLFIKDPELTYAYFEKYHFLVHQRFPEDTRDAMLHSLEVIMDGEWPT